MDPTDQPRNPERLSPQHKSEEQLADQKEISRRLLRAVLPDPDRVRDVAGMRIAARYEGSDGSLAVGGDWYVVDPLPAGDLVLAVGDVCGHGLSDAATMVKLRYTTTALAVAGYAPGAILAVLNDLLYQQNTGGAATAVVARYRPDTRLLTWARAGHLPIVLANRQRAGPLRQPYGITLGVVPDGRYEPATRRLQPGDMLLMYTDGFVEGPGHPIDHYVRLISDQARRAFDLPIADRQAALVSGLDRQNDTDDACALAAEVVASGRLDPAVHP